MSDSPIFDLSEAPKTEQAIKLYQLELSRRESARKDKELKYSLGAGRFVPTLTVFVGLLTLAWQVKNGTEALRANAAASRLSARKDFIAQRQKTYVELSSSIDKLENSEPGEPEWQAALHEFSRKYDYDMSIVEDDEVKTFMVALGSWLSDHDVDNESDAKQGSKQIPSEDQDAFESLVYHLALANRNSLIRSFETEAPLPSFPNVKVLEGSVSIAFETDPRCGYELSIDPPDALQLTNDALVPLERGSAAYHYMPSKGDTVLFITPHKGTRKFTMAMRQLGESTSEWHTWRMEG